MRQFFLLLLLTALLAACGQPKQQATVEATAADDCTLVLSVTLDGFQQTTLRTLDGTVIDTLCAEAATDSVVVADSTLLGSIALLRLENPADSLDIMEMPVALEKGVVKVQIGEYLNTAGTPTNRAIQDFLNDMQQTVDGVRSNVSLKAADIPALFSAFYKQQILTNRKNALAPYIYRMYGEQLTEEDRALVKAEMGY